MFTTEEIKEVSKSLQSSLPNLFALRDSTPDIYDVSKETAISLYDANPIVSALAKVDPVAAIVGRKLVLNALETYWDVN